MEYHGVEYRPLTVFLKRLRDLALLAGFSCVFMWLVAKLGTLCPTVLEHFAITSIF
ncbi:hypothetical protein GCM10009097_00960 [Pigmentiphaga daeguensis]|uniref:Uncharacterized protein n=2 Tax=Alcaligenaceae TaxID=506 RepID=A0ABN1B546_9BURK